MNARQQYQEAYRLWRRLKNWSDYSHEGYLNYLCLRNKTWNYQHAILYAALRSLDSK